MFISAVSLTLELKVGDNADHSEYMDPRKRALKESRIAWYESEARYVSLNRQVGPMLPQSWLAPARLSGLQVSCLYFASYAFCVFGPYTHPIGVRGTSLMRLVESTVMS